MTGSRLFIMGALLGIALIIIQYHLWFKPDGMRDVFRLKQVLSKQVAVNEKLKKRNEALLFQIERLQNGKDAAEARARNELGMIKKGEIFYQMVK